MSIYTVVERNELESYLEQYDLGTLITFKGIEAGVENTNYFVTTSAGEFVLTLVESVAEDALPFILGFAAHLAKSGIAAAQPVPNLNGTLFGTLNDRPAVFMNRLDGKPLERPTTPQCKVIGKTLAASHIAAESFAPKETDSIDLWCQTLATRVLPKLPAEEAEQLRQALVASEQIPWEKLPTGAIHADLFPDNALFNGDRLAGIIDFYHACSAPYLYDLAVMLNAWCYHEPSRSYNWEQANLLLQAYEAIRPLNKLESRWLGEMQKVAALRFWLSRLRDTLFPKPGAFITVKDPSGKRELLEALNEAGQ